MSKTMLDPQANPNRIDRVLARRRSNAAGPHASRGLRRQRTRAAVRLSLRKEAMV